MRKEIIVCDLWAERNKHYEFNKNIIAILKNIFYQNIKYLGEYNQINILKKDFDINFEDILTTKNKQISQYILYLKNILKIKNLGEDYFILNSLIPIILFCKLILRNKNIFFFVHGLDFLTKKNLKYYIFKYFILYLNPFGKNSNFKYIVLGENIKENLIKIFPYMKNQIFSIDHPYSFEKEYGNKEINEILKLGTVGITSQEKGLNNIFEFIEKNNEKFSFKHIGKSSTKMPEGFKRYFPYRNSFLEKDKFEEEILNLDYILILYPKDSYKLTASGVYFDCIKYNKPLLGLKNEYFEYMFKKYGEIGILFESIDEIIEYLSQERKILDSDYDIFHKNMKNIKKVLNKNVEKQLKEIIGA